MTRPVRVLHAIRSDGFAGVEQFVARLARAQAERGDHVTVIGGDSELMRARLEPAGIAHRTAVSTLDVARRIAGSAHDVDVVNTHMTAADVGATLALFGRRRRPRLVATRHFAKPRGRVGPMRIDSLVGRRIDTEISISAAVAAAIGVPSTVVQPGVEDRPFIRAQDRGRIILMGQRLQPEKHTHVGLRAFAASGLARRGWRLELAGDGPERPMLDALATSLGIGHAVEFLGFRPDLPDLMERAGLLLASCPFEHFGLTVLEAMAGGLPVVAAGAAGHAEMLDGLDPRAQFRPDDAQDAARKLGSLAEDLEGREALGRAERERQSREFSVGLQAARTDAVYRSVL